MNETILAAPDTRQIDLVLPLLLRDVDRAHLLIASLKKFWRVTGFLRIIVKDDELNELKRDQVLSSMSPQFICESEIVAKFPTSWWKQQICKLAASDIVSTKFYLTLDADCLMVRKATYDDLIDPQGRGRIQFDGRTNLLSDWYAGSSRLLKKPVPLETVSVTPFLLNRELVRRCRREIGPNWQDKLMQNTSWSEYTLYHVASAEVWNQYHFCESQLGMIDNCVWMKEQAEEWKAEKSFEDPKFFFSVIQSNTNLPASWTKERVQQYLDLDK